MDHQAPRAVGGKSSGFAALRAERLCLSGAFYIFLRLRLQLRHSLESLSYTSGKAEPFRTEGG
jgi:hypothetical protein